MALTMTYRAQTPVPVEVEGFTPDWTRDKTLAEIEQFSIFHGNQKLPIAEMFSVAGDPGDGTIVWEGDLAGVHWIGAHMTSGSIRVHGNVGRHLGSEMRGGEITVEGNAGGWVGMQMHRGLIRIKGDAGHLVGAAYRGSLKGMTGGTILVEGNAGDEVGLGMRRGLIAIAGSAGEMLAASLIAGSVLVFGDCGQRPGAGMRRGTIGIFGKNPPQLLPSFRYAARYQPQMVPLLLRLLRSYGFPVREELMSSEYDLFHGDLLSVGRGEILIPVGSAK
ncbi:formylmethanofuran dehydrogenase subunit C [Schlesneria sp. DSM 10557]|uniref:formylmethanofuran dehydrogenase subunit C n=1 Tax=Schlesneria sp. DSM 10557 TaxID=3044399 RepID=UPI00359F7589